MTEGLFTLPDEEVMGILAHEIGHIANRHCEIQLLIGGANVVIAGFLMLLKAFAGGCAVLFGVTAVKSRGIIKKGLAFLFAAIPAGAIWLWIKFCQLFLHISMRANEIAADTYAYEIGFGLELACALEKLRGNRRPRNGFLRAVNATHPDFHERIANLQNLGVEYYVY
ncbi:MAG: M48 family metalloprotease [Blautia sp.]|nr:M48 family metalloprotease [Blautia sp.]MCM1201887.1 M48 family metalloprotease [Bacteroides fragilis]